MPSIRRSCRVIVNTRCVHQRWFMCGYCLPSVVVSCCRTVILRFHRSIVLLTQLVHVNLHNNSSCHLHACPPTLVTSLPNQAMTSLAVLPAAALKAILVHLDQQDVANSRLACKLFYDVSCASVTALTPKGDLHVIIERFSTTQLQQVDLKYIRSVDALQASGIARLQFLRSLSLLDNPCWDAVRCVLLKALSTACQSLVSLELSSVTDDLAAQLAGFTQLQSLAISGRVSDQGLEHFSSLQRLQQLSLSCCDAITDSGLHILTSLTGLVGLQLHSCLQLGDPALQLIGQLTQLTSLCLSHSCEDASSSGLLSLTALQNLRQLNLSAASEGAAPCALAQLLTTLSQLTWLDVSFCESVNPTVLRAIGGLQQLDVLGLSGINPSSLHSLKHLKHLSSLQQLQLRWVGQLKDPHAAFLPHLASLTALDLSYCRSLTGDGLQQLVWLTQLRQLNLMAVGNDELSFLTTLQQLTGLTVSLLPYSCKAWEHIAALAQLQALALRRCTIIGGGGGSSSSSIDGGSTPGVEAVSSSNLSQLQRLTALDCNGSTLEAAAVSVLQQLPHLEHISLARCQNVSNAVLGALTGCSALRKLDLRLRGPGSTWNLKGLQVLLDKLPGLSSVYVNEVPVGLPEGERFRVLSCSMEQVALPVSRDAGCSISVPRLL